MENIIPSDRYKNKGVLGRTHTQMISNINPDGINSKELNEVN